MRLTKDMSLTNSLIVFIRVITTSSVLVHLFAFAANGNPQSGIEWQKAKIWKSTHTRADLWASRKTFGALYQRAPNSVSPLYHPLRHRRD